MDLGEEPFEGIGRAKFDLNSPDTDFEPGGNFKKPQPDQANGGMFQLSVSQRPSPKGADHQMGEG